MKTATHFGTLCVVLRKNSNGTSLVSFPPCKAGSDAAQQNIKIADFLKTVNVIDANNRRLTNSEGQEFAVTPQATVPTRSLVRTFPKPNPPRFKYNFL